jgi:hypothetical protein
MLLIFRVSHNRNTKPACKTAGFVFLNQSVSNLEAMKTAYDGQAKYRLCSWRISSDCKNKQGGL